MMKKIVCLVLFATWAHASYFHYADFHAMGGAPMVGVGIRTQEGFHGFDFSGHLALWPTPEVFHVKALYIAYPQQKGLYLGAGLGVANACTEFRGVSGTLEGALGYQWKRIFLEANAMAPFREIGEPGSFLVWPCLTLGIGF